MNYLGQYLGFKTYYLDLAKEDFHTALPGRNWFCCAIANDNFEDDEHAVIEKFIRTAIDRNLLSWHGVGQFGGKLHLTFDLIMVQMEVEENHPEIDVSTCGDNEGDMENDCWRCYGAPNLARYDEDDPPELICVSFDGKDYQAELENLIIRWNQGWLPADPVEKGYRDEK